MKGEISLKILERLKERGSLGSDLLKEFLLGKLSMGRGMNMVLYGRDECYETKKDKYEKESKRFHSMLYNLKKDGLIERLDKDGKSVLSITKKGINKLNILRKRQEEGLPNKNYKRQKSNKTSIIIFDIPEKYRRKRVWLRGAIINLGFEMVQKSVWIGAVKIPEDFLESLRDLFLIDYVEIFEITKEGSLKSLK